MSNIVNLIASKNFVKADSIISEAVELIMARKLEEAKKMVAAKIEEQPHSMNRTAARLRLMDIAEEDIEEAIDPEEKTQVSVEKGTPKPGPGSTHYKNMKEQIVNRDTKSSSPAYKSAQTRYTNRVITGKNTDGAIASSLARDDMTPQERMKSNKTQQINTQLKTPAPKAGGYTDARTNKPYVAPKAEQMPLRGPTTQGSSQVNTAGKSDRVVRPSPISTAGNTTTVKKVTYEETEEQLDEINLPTVNYQGGSGSSSVYTRSTKNPFSRGTEVLADKMTQNVGGTTQSYKSKTTVKNLGNNTKAIKSSSSTSNMNEKTEDQLDEARVKIVKARIRGGKIQRRKRVSNVPGYRVQGTQLQRMSPAERRRRKMGARKAKIKRRAKMSRTLMKRQRSIRRRKALGL